MSANNYINERIFKYPRTRHIEGSRMQTGDEDLECVPFKEVAGKHLVIEEKVDGANSGISFDGDANLLLQSRGHYLTGGPREKHFNLFKQWANTLAGPLFDILGDEFVLYGEWLYAKHTVFYDRLPHYFMEFDIMEKATGKYLDTDSRHAMLRGLPVVSVPVLARGEFDDVSQVTEFVTQSLYKSPDFAESLRSQCEKHGVDHAQTISGTDMSNLSEGIYIKHEENGEVVGRYKWVRADFLATILSSDGHWLERPIVPNIVAESC
jgi:hypothetical protein